MAMVQYITANKGVFPGQAWSTPQQNYDWILWKTYADAGVTPPAGVSASSFQPDIATTGIGPYLSLKPTNTKVMLCPSDPDAQERQNQLLPNHYPFSYQINWAIGSYPANSINIPSPRPATGGPYYRAKITQVMNSSEKVLLIEADERYDIDGQSAITQQMGIPASWCNLMADRHDEIFRNKADWAPNGQNGDAICNSAGKGNAGFCDGHAEYVPRSYVHTRKHSMPAPDQDYPGYTEPSMK
jgi:prepilin-type processing-associated H-X9-DG protein